MTGDNDKAGIFAQMQNREAIDTLFEKTWITLYRRSDDDSEAWFSGLLTPERVPQALKSTSWDLHWGDMRPSIVTYNSGSGDSEAKYERFEDSEVEPIVIAREHGTDPFHIELAEDIRLFLNLFPRGNGELLQYDGSGNAEVVAVVEAQQVRIKKSPLLCYLAARQMYLAILFDHIVTLEEQADNPLPEAVQDLEVREHDRTWQFTSDDSIGYAMSRLCGKRLLSPPERKSLNTGDDRDRYIDFMIGEDANATPLEYSADPSGLANLFGANPEAPNYLTPVHFRREVLDRYYHNPGRYEVEDGVVRYPAYWLLPIDDDHRDRVLVFLGDLGCVLPYTEQLHWRAYNILPDGALSHTARTRSFDAKPANGGQPEHRFKAVYQTFAAYWLKTHGWHLFRPLSSEDQHLWTKLHVPTSNNPAELDSQLLGLAKILVDSLNDSEIGTALGRVEKDERSLAKLERFLDQHGYLYTQRDMVTLRGIQSLRSTGAVHTRGSNYRKALRRLNLENQPAPAIVTALLNDAIIMLKSLTTITKQPLSLRAC